MSVDVLLSGTETHPRDVWPNGNVLVYTGTKHTPIEKCVSVLCVMRVCVRALLYTQRAWADRVLFLEFTPSVRHLKSGLYAENRNPLALADVLYV